MQLVAMPVISATPLAMLSACGGRGGAAPSSSATPTPTPTPADAPRLLLSRLTAPTVVCTGDSTMAYSHASSSFASSLIYNGNGTATITMPSAQPIVVGDKIGVQLSVDPAFKVIETAVLAVNGSAYTYALSPGQTPTLTSDTGVGITLRYANRASASGPMTSLNALTGRNINFINAAQPGDTMAALLKRFDTDIAPQGTGNRILLTIGINDTFGKGLSLTELKAGMNAILAKCKNIGAKLDILTPLPQPDKRNGWTIAKRDTYAAFRAWLPLWCAENGLQCTDWGGIKVGSIQVQDPGLSNNNPAANMLQADNIHPTQLAGWMAGQQLAKLYNTVFNTSVTKNLPRTVAECGALSCGLFTGTAGTVGPGVQGQIASGVTVQIQSGNATATAYQTARSLEADGDTAGNWQGVTLNAKAAGDQFQIRLPNLAKLLSNGDLLRVKGLARIVAGAELIKEFSFFCNSQTAISGNLLCGDMMVSNGQMAPFAANFTMMLGADIPVRGPEGVHGKPTNFIPVIQITAAAAGTMTVELACWQAGWVV